MRSAHPGLTFFGRTTSVILLTLVCFTPASLSSDFDPQPIIQELGLRASDTPINEKPGWAPKKVLVFMMPGSKEQQSAYRNALQKAAGEIELIIPQGLSFKINEESLSDIDGIIGLCTGQILKAASDNLRWIHNYTVGMDYCTGASDAQLDNITFTNNKRLSGPAIAEHAIAMMMSLARNFPAYHRAQAENKWNGALARQGNFGELKGKTILVVGLGGIGTEIARRAHALGMRVVATRNSSRSGPEFVDYVGLSDELHKLAGEADVIANALPLTAATTGMFDTNFFAAAKAGSIFISVGRGKSTVTEDLIAALNSGKLYGAGLDVTDPEPLPAESPLWQMERVIITPHISATGPETLHRSVVIAAENLRRYVAGEPMLNVVDLRRGY